jgi:hypothetical protein
VFVRVNDDTEIHAVNADITALNANSAGKVLRALREMCVLDGLQRRLQPGDDLGLLCDCHHSPSYPCQIPSRGSAANNIGIPRRNRSNDQARLLFILRPLSSSAPSISDYARNLNTRNRLESRSHSCACLRPVSLKREGNFFASPGVSASLTTMDGGLDSPQPAVDQAAPWSRARLDRHRERTTTLPSTRAQSLSARRFGLFPLRRSATSAERRHR